MSKTEITIKGDIPNGPLYRFFSKNKYAIDFMNGQFRLGWLRGYHRMEGDAREDPTEGTAQYTVNDPNQLSIILNKTTGKEINRIRKPGITNVSSSSLNENYIFCASEVTDNNNLTFLRKRFSEKVKDLPRYVIIYNTRKFTETIAQALGISEYSQYILGLKWFKVEYSKGENLKENESDFYLNVYQKPHKIEGKDFTCECEWRLAVFIKVEPFLVGLKNSSNIMFVSGEERLKRIAEYVRMDVEKLKDSPRILSKYEKKAPLWIENINISHSGGIQKIAKLLE
ncbi:MAG: hypothetical protein ACUZ8O_03055 [Candidatus Anammoxibacter sp.]